MTTPFCYLTTLVSARAILSFYALSTLEIITSHHSSPCMWLYAAEYCVYSIQWTGRVDCQTKP